MPVVTNFIKKYPVSAYFLLTFLVSWGGVIAVIGTKNIPATPEETTRLFPWALVAMLVGPSLTGLLLNSFGRGSFLPKLAKWRVGIQWYAIAILTVPVLTGTLLWLLSQSSPSSYLPKIITEDSKGALLLSGIGIGLAAGFFEEIGWTGFVTPLLKQKHGVLITGLVIGLLWGVWHFLVTFWASGDPNGTLSLDLLLPPLVFYVGVLPAYRVLMVWVYDRTESLPVLMFMHASLTTCTISLLSPPATGIVLIKYYIVLTLALWAINANLLRTREPIFQKKAEGR
jgi:membrane protease YdiL (CAAX protease family)